MGWLPASAGASVLILIASISLAVHFLVAWARLGLGVRGLGWALGGALLVDGLALGAEGIGSGLLAGTGILLFGAASGALVAHLVQRPSHILPCCVVASVADLWSVMAPQGPTRAIVQSPVAMDLLVLRYPLAGGDVHLLGVADLLFISMLLTLTVRFALPLTRTAVVLWISPLLALALASWCRVPLPALPLICTAFVVAHIKRLETSRKDLITLALFLLALGLLALVARMLLGG